MFTEVKQIGPNLLANHWISKKIIILISIAVKKDRWSCWTIFIDLFEHSSTIKLLPVIEALPVLETLPSLEAPSGRMDMKDVLEALGLLICQRNFRISEQLILLSEL